MATRPPTHKPHRHAPRHEPQPLTYGQGRGGRPWRRLRDQVMERDGYVCQCDDCKLRLMPLIAHEVDHHIPKSQGGTDDPKNLRAINRDCHKAKTLREGGKRYDKRPDPIGAGGGSEA